MRRADEVPDGSRVARTAKPFTGPGPHPVVVVAVTAGAQRDLKRAEQFELSATGGQCPFLHRVDEPTVAMLPSGDDVWRRLGPLVTAAR